MHKLLVIGAALIALTSGAPGAVAKGKVQCKPAITGWGSHSFAHIAKSKAIASYKAKATAAHGKIVWSNKIGEHCTKLQKGLGWQCWFKAQPCVDGGLTPSMRKSPHAKPPRLRAKAIRAPMSYPRSTTMPLRSAPRPGAPRGVWLR